VAVGVARPGSADRAAAAVVAIAGGAVDSGLAVGRAA
jgi:hypothetical protein